MNVVFHCVFGILATLFFSWRFYQSREPYQIALVVWIPSTFLTYISTNRTYSVLLSILELVLFFAFLILFLQSRKKREDDSRKREQMKLALKKIKENPDAEIPVCDESAPVPDGGNSSENTYQQERPEPPQAGAAFL